MPSRLEIRVKHFHTAWDGSLTASVTSYLISWRSLKVDTVELFFSSSRMVQAARPIYRSPLRYRDFLVFWTGSLVSGIGSQFTTVAMAWHIYELTDSPLQSVPSAWRARSRK
jgi:hypothetical protein